MYDNEFFVVDMASCTSTGEIINSLSLALETLNHSGKKIVLKLNDSYLNQSQMLSIQSLITSYGCILDTIETINDETARIAQNMNVFVQKPIEKRVEEKTEGEQKQEFEPFSMNVEPKAQDSIALKEVTGLHFEADLDALQKNQDNININSDLRNAGINPRSDFETIETQISSQYSKPQEIMPAIDDYSKIATSVEIPQFEDKNEFEKPKSRVFIQHDEIRLYIWAESRLAPYAAASAATSGTNTVIRLAGMCSTW